MKDDSPSPFRPLRPWLAALASALVPGLGQLITGRTRRGAVLLPITAAALVASAWMTMSQRLMLLKWSVQPEALAWLLVGNGLLLGFRVFAAADAFVGADDEPRPRGAGAVAAGAGAVLILGLLTIPHAVAGYADVTQYDLITTVFAPVTTTITTILPPTTVPSTEATAAGTPADPTSPPTTTTSTAPPTRIWDGAARINVLLLGGDARPSSASVRTDTMILASIDPLSGHIALFSLPRNMAQVPLPESIGIWRCDCFPGIINALWRYGDEHPDEFPDQGIPSGASAIKMAIGELTGLQVQYYALVNLTGFVEVIDAVGGVDITVPKRLYDANYGTEDGVTREVVDITPGEDHMGGHTALAYARSRRDSDDYSRMGRQRCVLQALAAQADPVTVIRVFPVIAAAVKKNLSTDIPIETLPDFIEILPLVDSEQIISVRFVPNQFTGPRTSDGYNTPDLDAIRNAIDVALTLPPTEALAALGLEDTAEECG
jgi:LCP family protein required for cell wall assembly